MLRGLVGRALGAVAAALPRRRRFISFGRRQRAVAAPATASVYDAAVARVKQSDAPGWLEHVAFEAGLAASTLRTRVYGVATCDGRRRIVDGPVGRPAVLLAADEFEIYLLLQDAVDAMVPFTAADLTRHAR